MNKARVVILIGLILSYLLPWQVYVIIDKGNRRDYVPGLLVCADLASSAFRNHDVAADGLNGEATNSGWAEAAVQGVFSVILVLPFLVALFALLRFFITPELGPPGSPPTAVALAILSLVALIGATCLGPLDVIRGSSMLSTILGPSDRDLVGNPLVPGPIMCFTLSIAFAVVSVLGAFRRDR